MTQGIWPAVLGRFDWSALPFVRAWENPSASEIIGAGAALIVIVTYSVTSANRFWRLTSC